MNTPLKKVKELLAWYKEAKADECEDVLGKWKGYAADFFPEIAEDYLRIHAENEELKLKLSEAKGKQRSESDISLMMAESEMKVRKENIKLKKDNALMRKAIMETNKEIEYWHEDYLYDEEMPPNGWRRVYNKNKFVLSQLKALENELMQNGNTIPYYLQ